MYKSENNPANTFNIYLVDIMDFTIRFIYILFFIFLILDQSNAVEYSRRFAPDTVVAPGDTIWITVEFQNSGSDTLTGLVYSEQIGQDLQIIKGEILKNKEVYNQISYETGNLGQVYSDLAPYRWIIQLPLKHAPEDFILPGDQVVLKYGLTSQNETSFFYNYDDWYGGFKSGSEIKAVFGFDAENAFRLSFANPKDITHQKFLKPEKFLLFQNYPNPYNNETKIQYYLPKISLVQFEIFSLSGKKISTINQGTKAPGFHTIHLQSDKWCSGIYYYRIIAGNYSAVRKMIILK